MPYILDSNGRRYLNVGRGTALAEATTARSGVLSSTDKAKIDTGTEGPGSSTDNAVALFDGVTGFKIKNSAIIVDGSSNMTGVNNITPTGTVDGRDIAADGTKLDGIEALADVTDATNVNAAGACMISDIGTNGVLAKDHLGSFSQPTGSDGTIFGIASPANSDPAFLTATEARTVLNVEDGADVTDATNVNTAGATMRSLYNANTILAATVDDVPAALTVAEDTLVGRTTGNNIDSLTVSEVREMLHLRGWPFALGTPAANSNTQMWLRQPGNCLIGDSNSRGYTFPWTCKIVAVSWVIDVDAYSSATIEIRTMDDGSVIDTIDTGINATGQGQSGYDTSLAETSIAAGSVVQATRYISSGTATTNDMNVVLWIMPTA